MSALDVRTLVRDFGDARAEALRCRADCALFDFSFVRRARLRGRGAGADVSAFCARALEGLTPGALRYALRLSPAGAVQSDLTVWRLDEHTWEVMSGRAVDLEQLAQSCQRDTEYRDLSAGSLIYAVQGPGALRALAPLGDVQRLRALGYFRHAPLTLAGVPCHVGRLGYTGEQGFEIIAPARHRDALWQALAARATPAGFAAADCLRIEAGLLLFVHDCRLGATPAELGLARFSRGGSAAPRYAFTAFAAATELAEAPWIAPTEARAPDVGEIAVTSACMSPHLERVIGLGFVAWGQAVPGTRVRDPRGEFGDVHLLARPPLTVTRGRARQPWR